MRCLIYCAAIGSLLVASSASAAQLWSEDFDGATSGNNASPGNTYGWLFTAGEAMDTGDLQALGDDANRVGSWGLGGVDGHTAITPGPDGSLQVGGANNNYRAGATLLGNLGALSGPMTLSFDVESVTSSAVAQLDVWTVSGFTGSPDDVTIVVGQGGGSTVADAPAPGGSATSTLAGTLDLAAAGVGPQTLNFAYQQGDAVLIRFATNGGPDGEFDLVVDNLSIDGVPIPEPTALALVALLSVGRAAARRRM